jgi:phytoene dehydrogenase-like protein
MEDLDVVVVGAGLAGLRCAAVLQQAGAAVVVVEAGDEVGGRIRTEQVDGFTLDRGFQVVNPAYPALRAAVDVGQLDLQRFPAGVRLRTDAGVRTLADPLRAPGLVGQTAAALARRPGELWSMARWAGPLLTGLHRDHGLAGHLLRSRADTSLRESLDRAGAHGLLRAALERYLAGVVLEDAGETSAAFALLLVRSFARGTPGLPRAGMQALPRAVAAPLLDRIRLGERAEALDRLPDRVRLTTAGGVVHARRAVVATDAWSAEALLGSTGFAAPAPKGVVTDWYAVDEPPTGSGLLHVDVSGHRGPAVNACVVSQVARGYAPPGRHLVQVTSLLQAEAAPEPETRRHAGRILGASTSGWELLVRHQLPHALPIQPPPLQARRDQQVDAVTWVCGDHRDTASAQGALVSGARAGRAVAASLGLARG